MTLAKIVADGVVVKAPEKRFTQNNLAITNLTINLNQNEETLVRVMSMGNLAETVENTIKVGDRVIVDGRLQVETYKTQDGKDKRIVQINASTIEKIGATTAVGTSAPTQNTKSEPDSIVQFADKDIVEDLIDEDEIPF